MRLVSRSSSLRTPLENYFWGRRSYTNWRGQQTHLYIIFYSWWLILVFEYSACKNTFLIILILIYSNMQRKNNFWSIHLRTLKINKRCWSRKQKVYWKENKLCVRPHSFLFNISLGCSLSLLRSPPLPSSIFIQWQTCGASNKKKHAFSKQLFPSDKNVTCRRTQAAAKIKSTASNVRLFSWLKNQ